jgi:hypothetical protein
MESLESKIDRLSPEQRREVEDFVDFLLYRYSQAPVPIQPGTRPSPPVRNVAPPPLTLIEPVHVVEYPVSRPPDPSPAYEREPSAAGNSDAFPAIQEIGAGTDDPVSHDYMDYGRFEQQPSPAGEAVKKVKAKLSRSEEQNRSNHLLDWID